MGAAGRVLGQLGGNVALTAVTLGEGTFARTGSFVKGFGLTKRAV